VGVVSFWYDVEVFVVYVLGCFVVEVWFVVLCGDDVVLGECFD